MSVHELKKKYTQWKTVFQQRHLEFGETACARGTQAGDWQSNFPANLRVRFGLIEQKIHDALTWLWQRFDSLPEEVLPLPDE